MNSEHVKQMIESGLSGSIARVTGDGNHFEATVIYQGFTGKTRVQQHQLVYSTLSDNLQSNTIHALSINTYTPQEWETTQTT